MYKKLNNKEYIIPVKAISNVENIVNKINTKRERLIEKGQISEDDFQPFDFSYQKININELKNRNLTPFDITQINDNKRTHALLKFSGEVPNINKWSILGVIEPVLGQKDKYTLHSYTNKDLPKFYRDLENPNQCEHCDKNRQRNKTFVIQNKESDEILQVGSSCMSDFINKQSLSLLMSYSNLFNEVKEAVEKAELQQSIEMVNKEEFVATLDALSDMKRELGKLPASKAQLAFNYFESLEDPKKKGVFEPQIKHIVENIKVSEKNLDSAENILDFFEELDESVFNDQVFNVKTLIGSDFDFLSQKECHQVENCIEIYDAIKNQKPEMQNFLGKFHKGVTINGKTEVLPNEIDKKTFIATLNAIAENDGKYNSYLESSLINPAEVDKALFLTSDKHFLKQYNNIVEMMGEEYAETFKERLNNIKVSDKHHLEARDVIEFFRNENITGKTDYQNKMIEVLGNDKENISLKDAKFCGYAYHFYLKNKQDEQYIDVVKNIEEKQEKGILNHIGYQKDRFEQIELQYLSKDVKDSDFGKFYIHHFKDIHGNSFSATSSKENPLDENSANDNDNIGKWITISASVKKHSTRKEKLPESNSQFHIDKKTHLNRIKAVSDFSEKPKTEGDPILKSKYHLGDLKVSNVEQYDNSFIYHFKDADDKDYSFLTQKPLNLEQDSKIKAGFQLSMNGTDIFNIKRESVKNINSLENEWEQLTEKQLDKKIEPKKVDKKPIKNK